MVIYYQHFIPNYSIKAMLLFDLLKGQKGRMKNGKKLSCGHQNNKLKSSDWTQRQQQRFERLKASLVESVVLAHPDFSRPFILTTDASLERIRAVLLQIQEGEMTARPFAFMSKSLFQLQRSIQLIG